MLKKIIYPFTNEYILRKSKILGLLPDSKTAYKTVFSLSWPSVVEAVLISVVSAVDTIMVGGLGAGAIAAVGLTNQPKFLLLAVIISLNIGVTAISSRRKGENNALGANTFLRQSLIFSFILSLTVSLLGFVFAKDILTLAGAGDDVIHLSIAYYQILMVSIFFTGISLTINAAQRGVGNTKISMKSNLVANIVNLIGNYLLINGIWIFPRLGVSGAAMATSIGSFVACLMSVLSLYKKNSFLILRKKYNWTMPLEELKSFFSIAGSSAVEQVFQRIGFFAYALTVAKLGTISFAVHQICFHIVAISFCFGDGVGMGTSSLVGQSLGEK